MTAQERYDEIRRILRDETLPADEAIRRVGELTAEEDSMPRCSGCRAPVGGQHRPSCSRQGMVTADSDYRTVAEMWADRRTK